MSSPTPAIENIALIDGVGPFFRGCEKRRINWSKIPFLRLATGGEEREAQWSAIRADLEQFAAKVAGLGYNAISLDDVAHLTDHEWYEPEVRARIAVFSAEFRKIFALMRKHGLRVFVTVDFATTTPAIDERLGEDPEAISSWFCEVVRTFLSAYPEVEGIILRIGESDGRDVEDPLRSRLIVRTAREVNQLLRTLLPVFEEQRRLLIFRTWTVGAYLIGDLIWHRGRLASALRDITSPALIVSMKHGESDFFRYLPINRQFFRIDLPKIIELQARREYEGAGEYPSFIGWDCEHFARELHGARNVVGFSVWCQTGGWHGFRRFAFLDPKALWIDLNCMVAIRIFKDGRSVEETVAEFFGPERAARALELLRRSDIVIRDLLYVREFAQQKLFFRRVRIPPLLHVYWDSVFLNEAVRRILSQVVHDPENALREGEAAFLEFDRMLSLATELDLPVEDIEFMRDTFHLILLARRYYFLPPDEVLCQEIKSTKKAYKQRWPKSLRPRYRVRVSFASALLTRQTITWIFRLFVRRQRGYRTVLDRIFTLNVLSWIYRLFHIRHEAALPKFFRKTAMGLGSVLK